MCICNKRMIKNKLYLAVFVLGLFILVSGGVLASQMMALQGNVKNSTGGDLATGNLTVEIWNALSAGALIYNSSTTYNNNITSGRYDVMLGEYTALNLNYGQNYYMAIAINSEPLSFDGNSRRVFQPTVGLINSSFLNLTANTTITTGGNVTSSGWFNGLFNWVIETASKAYLSFNGNELTFNETKLNETIDARSGSGSSSSPWVSSATTIYNITANVGIGTVTPNSSLHVNGTLTLSNGSDSNSGKIYVDSTGDMIFRI